MSKKLFSIGWRLSLATLSILGIGAGLLAAWPVRQHTPELKSGLAQVLVLREHFGVSHPQQIVHFETSTKLDPKSSYLLDSDGQEVAMQVMYDGSVAVLADLPANSARTWKLMTGRAPAPVASGVKITESTTYYEITNGLTGVRVPLRGAGMRTTPAPIQGIRYRDGQWTATGPNRLSVDARQMEVRFVELGPIKVVVEVTYTLGAGTGYYKSTVELQAGQPSVLVEEDMNVDVSYTLDVYKGLHPDQARYRGHHSTSAAEGREAEGRQYRQAHERPAMDAFVDLRYDTPREYPRMAIWNPWVVDSGIYWQLYNQQAPANANLFGIFAGRASRALGAGNSGVSVVTAPTRNNAPVAGVNIASYRRNTDDRVFPRSRFQWGIFVGTKGQDLADPGEVQPINRQMNLHGGVNLDKVRRYQLTYAAPDYGRLYMEPAALDRVIAKVRADRSGPQGDGYYGWLSRNDPLARDLIDAWTDTTGTKVRHAASGIKSTATALLEALVHGQGIYHYSNDPMKPSFAYFLGGFEMNRKGVWIDQVLANPLTTPEDRASVQAAAVLFAEVLWDDDFAPLFEGHGLNLGNPNMPVMQQGFRDFFALFLSKHPAFRLRAAGAEQRALRNLHDIVNEHGAEMGGVNYIEPSFVPTLNTLLQLRMLGRDHFQTEPRLSRFAEFYMNLLTPPEVRFGGVRKVISVGDGSTQAPQIVGSLATGFRNANPALSARLMGAWESAGRPHSSAFGSTILKVDERAPAADPALGSATFPGWYSVLRYGWGTKNETALWFVNGDFYRDHRHVDQGSVVLYALGAPLSLDWGSTYEPQVAGGFMHNMVLPMATLGVGDGGAPPQETHGWNHDGPPLNSAYLVWGVPPWGKSTQDGFLSFGTGSYARAHFTSAGGTVWTRSTYSIYPNESYPIILIRDTFGGTNGTASKVFTLNMAAQGHVDTPAGRVSPTLRTYNHQWHADQSKKELPSAGRVFSLSPGPNRLGFTGQWLIDWDLYVLSDEPQQAHIGNWGHNWHPAKELGEFKQANGRDFEERQHILRIAGGGPFNVLILPYRKGEKRKNLQVRREGSKTVIATEKDTTVIGRNFFTYHNSQQSVLTAFDKEPATATGISTVGGPLEIVVRAGNANITLQGSQGSRKVALAGKWRLANSRGVAVRQLPSTGEWLLDYSGGPSGHVSLIKTAR